MARLERTPGAGGRRKARREEQESSQRAQRGKRPEESRSERQADADPSRRSTEAKARERSGSSQPIQGSTEPGQSSNASAQISQSTGQSFQSHLAAQEELQPEFYAEPGGQKQPAGTTPDPMVSTAPQQTAVLHPPKTSGAGSIQNNVGTGNHLAATNHKGSLATAAAAPALSSAGAAFETKEKKVPSVPVAVPNREMSEAQEAQRASQVLRQLRMDLHPGLRSATVHLHPAELGRLQIKIRTSDGEVKGVIRADSEETLAILERHVPELEAAFADQGFEEMSFEFVLDQKDSQDPGAWNFDRDVSAELESRLEQQQDPDLRGHHLLSDLGVDTYA